MENLSLKRRVYRKLCYIFCKHIPDKLYIKMMYQVRMGKKCNLKNPSTYNEKLNWIKLYDRNPKYVKLVDKITAREVVEELIGSDYLIPLLGKWKNVNDININDLPEQFVLKCTHDSGSVIICKDKKTFDFEDAEKKLDNSMKINFFYTSREWPYKSIKPQIIAEAYVEDENEKELRDYKFFCFDGKVKALFVAIDRGKDGEEVKFDFFDENYNRFPMKQGHPNAPEPPQKPSMFEDMKRLAEILSKNIPHVRIDFYQANNRIYFSEFTFFHHSGFVNFDPEEYDYKFGDWIRLPR